MIVFRRESYITRYGHFYQFKAEHSGHFKWLQKREKKSPEIKFFSNTFYIVKRAIDTFRKFWMLSLGSKKYPSAKRISTKGILQGEKSTGFDVLILQHSLFLSKVYSKIIGRFCRSLSSRWSCWQGRLICGKFSFPGLLSILFFKSILKCVYYCRGTAQLNYE